ncbi:hypothetical protein R3P38DRAFT_2382640, partial [Favolaschia claudopus]
RRNGLRYFVKDATVKRNLKHMESMDTAVHSDDEWKNGRLVAYHPAWRSRNETINDFFHIPDVLQFATHFRSLGCKHRTPGQLPAIRTHLPDVNPVCGRIPVGLPENMYDEHWLRRYKEDEPLLYGTLKVQPPISLRELEFSPHVKR